MASLIIRTRDRRFSVHGDGPRSLARKALSSLGGVSSGALTPTNRPPGSKARTRRTIRLRRSGSNVA